MSEPDAATPTPQQEAQTKLDGLIANPAWGKNLFAGDEATRTEFDMLTRTIAADTPAANAEALVEATRGRQFNESVDAFAEQHGLSAAIADQIKTDRPVTEAEMRAAENWMARHTEDQAWVAKLMKGDVEAVREFATANVILASRVVARSS